jgi:hypothetical protein
MCKELLIIIAFMGSASAISPCLAQSRRVQSPDWNSIDVSDVFFVDAFREAIQGERPTYFSAARSTRDSSPNARVPSRDSGAKSAKEFRWSTVISRETIEDEIKRLSRQLDDSITQSATFASGGYQEARQQFSMLAALFAIVDEYDGDIRWKSSAAAARDRFAYAASIAKVGTVQVFNAAKKSRSALADLIRGDQLAAELNDRGTWIDSLDRSTFMQRLEQAQQGVIEPALASATEMKSQRNSLINEAEIVAAVSQILLHEGMDESDDEQYAQFCRDLQQGAAAVVRAVKQNDYHSATQASGMMSKSCSNCHETFRG